MSDELRQEIERALRSRLVVDQAVGYVDGPRMADAVMAVVAPLVEQLHQAEVSRDAYRDERDQTQRERDEARASVEHLRGDYRRIRKDRDRLLLAWRSARRRANQLRWLHAEAVWQLPEDAEELLTAALEDKQSGIVTTDDAGPEFDAQYAAIVALNLVRSWRPATVEAEPATPAEPFGVQLMREGMERSLAEAEQPRDPWRMAEWNALPDICLIDGCQSIDADQRGPIFLRDGSIHKACSDHWEAIVGILGQQAGSTDAAPWSAAGVSETGTEAPLADVPETEWRGARLKTRGLGDQS